MSILEKNYVVTMEDNSKWAIKVSAIAANRASYYKHEFDNNFERSLDEDTVPLFESDKYEIHDWAANNMNWDEVRHLAVCVSPSDIDFQDGWCNGEHEVI